MRKQTDKEKPKPVDAPDAPENEAPSAGPHNAGEGTPAEDKAPDDGEAKENGEGAADKETAESQEPSEEKPAGEAAGPAPKPEAEEAAAEEQPPATPPAAPDEDTEKAQLASDLLAARSKLAAYAAGVAPDMIADAVTLATAEAGPGADEAAVTKAMQAVLKRHPEWKADGEKKKSGGFKLGADPDKAGGRKPGGGDAPKNAKRWNRFK